MAKQETTNIGIKVNQPSKSCNDINCPFHGSLNVRGRQFNGTVISIKMRKTATIEFERLQFIKKYERYEKRRTRLKVHSPECLDVKEGDVVLVAECRPLSKTKNFTIIQNNGQEKGFKEKMIARESSKVIKAAKEEEKAEEQ